MLSKNKNLGFSLVEMIIYISILTVILFVIFNTVISFMSSYNNLKSLRIVEHSAIDAMERISRDIRSSSNIDVANSSFGSNPGVLTLITTSGGNSTTTKYYLQNNIIKVDINGTYFGPLSLSNALTTNLVFTRMTSTNSQAVKIDMTVQGTSGTVTKIGTYHTTVILKGQ